MNDPTRETLVSRMHDLRDEIEQIFTDADHWNRTHPEEGPLNPDPHGQLRLLHNRLSRFFLQEKRKGNE